MPSKTRYNARQGASVVRLDSRCLDCFDEYKYSIYSNVRIVGGVVNILDFEEPIQYPCMMYRWVNETGATITTKSIKDFAQKYGFRESNARSLACGHYQSLNGWCSGHKSAKKKRKRFTTELINTVTGERKIIGRSVTSFARLHGLSVGRLSRLVNGSRLMYRSWMLRSTFENAQGSVPEMIS